MQLVAAGCQLSLLARSTSLGLVVVFLEVLYKGRWTWRQPNQDFKPKVKADIEDLLRQQVAEAHPAKSRHSSTSSKPGAKKKIKCKAITSKTVQWPSLPPNKLGVMSPVKKTRVNTVSELIREKPISRKSTVVHEEVIRSRDLVFEELMIMNNNIMEEINKMEETKHQAEQRWIGRWRNSVDNVKQLYAL